MIARLYERLTGKCWHKWKHGKVSLPVDVGDNLSKYYASLPFPSRHCEKCDTHQYTALGMNEGKWWRKYDPKNPPMLKSGIARKVKAPPPPLPVVPDPENPDRMVEL